MPKLQLKKIIFFKFLTIFLSILNLNNFGKTLGLYFIQKSSRSNKNWLNESYLKAKIANFPYLTCWWGFFFGSSRVSVYIQLSLVAASCQGVSIFWDLITKDKKEGSNAMFGHTTNYSKDITDG